MTTPLCIIAEKYLCDKTPKYHHHYTPEYYEILKNKKYEKVLEIGIGYPELMCKFTNENYKQGASLYMWKEFFETSHIFGCDIREIKLEGMNTFVCDQSNPDSLEKMMWKIGYVDFIIDDGSHIPEHQKISFKTLWKYCRDIYIIEDIHKSNLDDMQKELEDTFINCKCIKNYCHPSEHQGFLVFQKKSILEING